MGDLVTRLCHFPRNMAALFLMTGPLQTKTSKTGSLGVGHALQLRIADLHEGEESGHGPVHGWQAMAALWRH